MNTPTPNFDNLLLQTLISKLHLHSASPPPLEDLLFDTDDSDTEEDSSSSAASLLAKEESRLEKEIIRTILSGKPDTLKPNSGQAVSIGEHHICVGFHSDSGSEYRVWEWHGHIMLFDEENGYTPEYIYGNYFERVGGKMKGGIGSGSVVVDDEEEEDDDENEEEDEEKVTNLGLKDLIESGESNGGRILHRNVNAGSPRFVVVYLHID